MLVLVFGRNLLVFQTEFYFFGPFRLIVNLNLGALRFLLLPAVHKREFDNIILGPDLIIFLQQGQLVYEIQLFLCLLRQLPRQVSYKTIFLHSSICCWPISLNSNKFRILINYDFTWGAVGWTGVSPKWVVCAIGWVWIPVKARSPGYPLGVGNRLLI